jgi:hypothetical protein
MENLILGSIGIGLIFYLFSYASPEGLSGENPQLRQKDGAGKEALPTHPDMEGKQVKRISI